MIFDWIEWDEHNLSHATRRLTAMEIEQAIWNAAEFYRHREFDDRVLFRSVTDGGRRVVIVASLRDHGVRPITGWEQR